MNSDDEQRVSLKEGSLSPHLAIPALTALFSGVLLVEGVALHVLAPQAGPIYIGSQRWAHLYSLALDPLALSVLGAFFLAVAIASWRRPRHSEKPSITVLFPAIASGAFALMATTLLFTI